MKGELKIRFPKPKLLLGIAVALPGLALAGWFLLPFALPLPEGLLEETAVSPVLMDRHGEPLHHLTLADSTRAAPLEYGRIPRDVIACTLAAEDKRFFDHGGVDLLATARAARDFVARRRVTSGASTITQQLIKISSPPRERKLATKWREALGARRLEMTWSKEKILETYLNRLDYGNLRIGVAEASRFYFQKPPADLSLAECALLAGLPQAPSRLNPVKHPERAVRRRNVVLERLAAGGNYDESRISTALREPLNLRPLKEARAAPWLPAFPPGGGEWRTTLDLALQRDVEAIVREETAKLRDANLRHAAVVAIHNPTGEILALVSSASWSDARGGQFNGALTPRSPGSALKPFTYLLAMERNGRTPVSILADIPSPFRTPQGLDLPENYDRRYRGPVTLRAALACSLNVPALRELNDLGGPEPLYGFLEKAGISTLEKEAAHYGLGLTLGNAPVRLLELTNVYATLARQGRHFPPVLFLPAAPAEGVEVHSAMAAYLIADILSDAGARAPAFPPGGPLDLPFRCAVKTGTSSDFRDNWCIGFTPDFTVGVWAGNFENQPMKGVSGVDGAGPVFNRTMRRLHRSRTPVWYERPGGLVEVEIDRRTGKRLSPSVTRADPHVRKDRVPAERLPPVAAAADYDAQGRALVGPVYAEWFQGRFNLRMGELALDESGLAFEPLRIIRPADGATYLLDPEIPAGSGRLRPVTNLPGVVDWTSETLRIEASQPEPVIHLIPGTHVLVATDRRNGTTRSITLHVKSL